MRNVGTLRRALIGAAITAAVAGPLAAAPSAVADGTDSTVGADTVTWIAATAIASEGHAVATGQPR